MRKLIIIFFSLLLANCSLNKDSQYWTENSIEKKNNQKKLNVILKKADDITSMTLEEYEIYICLLYTSPSPRDGRISRMPSSA